MRTHDAWLVDLDGTLYRLLPIKLAMAAQVLVAGPRTTRILRRFRQEHEALRGRSRDPGADSPFGEQLQRTAVALGLQPSVVEDVVRQYMIERPSQMLRPWRNRELLREIAAFRDDGGRTAVVSDYPAQQKLTALGVTELFDRVIANGEPGGPPRLKPAPDGLRLAASALGVEPSRCLVLGDRQDADGKAAAAAGMEFRLIS